MDALFNIQYSDTGVCGRSAIISLEYMRSLFSRFIPIGITFRPLVYMVV
jgi:hypothetical protein